MRHRQNTLLADFVYNDEIVIVDPHDMRIVEVLPV